MLYKECIEMWRKGLNQKLIDRFFIKFTYSSNKIENSETRLVDVEKVFKGEKINDFKGSKETIKEIENHKEFCNNILRACKDSDSKLSLDLIKHFHKAIMKGCFKEELLRKGEIPGEFKKGDYVVGVHDVGVSPEDVEENLISLIDEVNEVEITPKNALKIVSFFHCWCMSIHPFADGNGRVGRILLNYLLMGNNLPPIIVFEADKREYYLALEDFNETQEISEMVKFLEGQAYKTWIKDYNVKLKNLKEFLD